MQKQGSQNNNLGTNGPQIKSETTISQAQSLPNIPPKVSFEKDAVDSAATINALPNEVNGTSEKNTANIEKNIGSCEKSNDNEERKHTENTNNNPENISNHNILGSSNSNNTKFNGFRIKTKVVNSKSPIPNSNDSKTDEIVKAATNAEMFANEIPGTNFINNPFPMQNTQNEGSATNLNSNQRKVSFINKNTQIFKKYANLIFSFIQN